MSLGVFLGASHRIRAHEVTQCDKAFATEVNCCKGYIDLLITFPEQGYESETALFACLKVGVRVGILNQIT
jgi:hypothetical protein